MGLFDSVKKAVDPTSGWANPMSYGPQAFDSVLGSGSFKDFIPGVGDARAQERANQLNIQLAEQNRQWMERMSNTAYQRGMQDMKKAGLNPMLAYQQGGASVPNASAATVAAASKTGLVDKAMQAYTGISAARTQQQQANTAQAASESSISLQGAQTAREIAQKEKTEAETAKTIDSIKNQQVRRKLEQAQIPLAKVKESAATLAEKGTSAVSNWFDVMFKSSSKPNPNDPATQKRVQFLKEQTKSIRKQKD